MSLLVFIYMWLLWGWNAWNGDYEAYEAVYLSTTYDTIWTTNIEKGYFLINYIFNNIFGLKFSSFMIVFAFFVLSIVYYLSSKICDKVGYFNILYFVIFILEYVYMRNALSHVLILFVLLVSIYNNKISKKKFIIYILLCAFIHASSLTFLILVFAISNERKFSISKIVKYAIVVFAMGFFLFNFVSGYFGGFFLHKLNAYSGFSGISNSFVGLIVLVALSVYYYNNCLNVSVLSQDQMRIRIMFININLLCLFLLTFFYFLPYFARLFRLLLMFNLIGYLYFFKYVLNLRLIRHFRTIIFVFYFSFALLLLQNATHLWSTYPLFNVNRIFGISYYESIY
ncbi:EpsG family protein [Myroides sp. C6-3]